MKRGMHLYFTQFLHDELEEDLLSLWTGWNSLMRGECLEAVFPKAWRQRLPKPTNWVRLSVTFTSLDFDAHECGGCDCCHEKFDIDQKMAEMHDHLLHSICERTGLSEEEVDQKLMEISEVML